MYGTGVGRSFATFGGSCTPHPYKVEVYMLGLPDFISLHWEHAISDRYYSFSLALVKMCNGI